MLFNFHYFHNYCNNNYYNYNYNYNYNHNYYYNCKYYNHYSSVFNDRSIFNYSNFTINNNKCWLPSWRYSSVHKILPKKQPPGVKELFKLLFNLYHYHNHYNYSNHFMGVFNDRSIDIYRSVYNNSWINNYKSVDNYGGIYNNKT